MVCFIKTRKDVFLISAIVVIAWNLGTTTSDRSLNELHSSQTKNVKPKGYGDERSYISFMNSTFDISRGVLQGEIFSPVAFITGLMQIFKTHDSTAGGVTVGTPPNQVTITSLEYADDAGLADENVDNASARVSAITADSRSDASMEIYIPKTKSMHIPKRV